jgi:hypothetical protein
MRKNVKMFTVVICLLGLLASLSLVQAEPVSEGDAGTQEKTQNQKQNCNHDEGMPGQHNANAHHWYWDGDHP